MAIRNALQRENGRDEYFYRSKQIGSVTGRISTPIQGIPKDPDIRSIIKAPQGYKLVHSDFKTFEPRILMGLADDENGIQLFNQGKDIYRELAIAMGVSGAQLDLYRSVFKKVVNSIHYGGDEKTVHGILQVNYPDIQNEYQNVFNSYLEMFPQVKPWIDQTIQQAKSSGEIRTQKGRRLIIDENTKDGSIINFLMQGNASDIFKLVLVKLDQRLNEPDARIIHTILDAVLLEEKSEQVNEISRIVREAMNEAFAEIIPNVQSDVDIVCGDDWGHCDTPVYPTEMTMNDSRDTEFEMSA